MIYNFQCTSCGGKFQSEYQGNFCNFCHKPCAEQTGVDDLFDAVVDVALAYTGVTAAVEVADAVGELVGSLFSWD